MSQKQLVAVAFTVTKPIIVREPMIAGHGTIAAHAEVERRVGARG